MLVALSLGWAICGMPGCGCVFCWLVSLVPVPWRLIEVVYMGTNLQVTKNNAYNKSQCIGWKMLPAVFLHTYFIAVGSPSNEKSSTTPPRTSSGTTGLNKPIWLGLNDNNTSTDWPGLMCSCEGEEWKCAVECSENVTGKLADSLFTVHSASIWLPTGQSPNLNTGLGEMDSRTGKAVPRSATSTLEPRKDETTPGLSEITVKILKEKNHIYRWYRCAHLTNFIIWNKTLFTTCVDNNLF